jgi:hypothetical protein
VKDPVTLAVLLNVGDHAMFTIEFRAGGPNVTHDFQVLELLAHVVVPAVVYDPGFAGPYTELLPRAADRGEVCEMQARIDQSAVEAWYRDYKTGGEHAYIASHYGDARAVMIGSGNRALAETFRAMMGRMNMG